MKKKYTSKGGKVRWRINIGECIWQERHFWLQREPLDVGKQGEEGAWMIPFGNISTLATLQLKLAVQVPPPPVHLTFTAHRNPDVRVLRHSDLCCQTSLHLLRTSGLAPQLEKMWKQGGVGLLDLSLYRYVIRSAYSAQHVRTSNVARCADTYAFKKERKKQKTLETKRGKKTISCLQRGQSYLLVQ